MSIFSKRRKVRLSNHRMADSPQGPIRISHDRWPSVIALVDGPGIPAVTVLPGRGMSMNGQQMPARQGTRRGWDPRRKARIRTVLVGDRGYELRPTGLLQARLLRDGALIATTQGSLRDYSPLRKIPGIDAHLSWSHGIDPIDVAIGQAMVVAFGTGAQAPWLSWLSSGSNGSAGEADIRWVSPSGNQATVHRSKPRWTVSTACSACSPGRWATYRCRTTEITRGRNIADAVLTAGAAHLVFASVPAPSAARASECSSPNSGSSATSAASTCRRRSCGRFRSWRTMLIPPSASAPARWPLAADVPEQLIALEDIGAFAAMAFNDPGTHLGQTIDIAGDALTPPQIAQALSKATTPRHPVRPGAA